MTVCVAAICRSPKNDGWSIIAAADRMLTAGILEFEHPETKIHPLTSSIAVMTAGDSGIQPQIMYAVSATVIPRVRAEPDNWWSVKDVVELYVARATDHRKSQAERLYLSPLGLTLESWVGRQHEMSPDLVLELAAQLRDYPAPDVEAIVFGRDSIGHHIYAVRPDSSGRAIAITCEDSVGFAAIGSGSWHADSYLMLSGSSSRTAFAEALRLVHAAKRRSEVAPGVGAKVTDIFVIGALLGENVVVAPNVVEKLDAFYERDRKAAERVELRSQRAIGRYVEDLLAAPPQNQAATPAGSATSESAKEPA